MERRIKRYQEPRNGIQYIVQSQTRKELSPFAFFDAGMMKRSDEGLFIGMHPHSGIGIITYFEGGDLQHGDSGANDDVIRSGGVQWIRSGSGVWHEENYLKPVNAPEPWQLTIHQLWMQLPPELEESSVEYQNVQPEQLPVSGKVKVVIGSYDGLSSPIETPYNMTYLDVDLSPGEVFELQTPAKQTRGFVFPRIGDLSLYGQDIPLRTLSILEENEGTLMIEAKADARFVLVLSEPQETAIYTRGGSIHTSEATIERSFQRIKQIGAKRNYVTY